jgi:multidrug efflux pump
VTAFGLFLTPVFYVLLRGLTGNRALKQHGEIPHDVEAPGVIVDHGHGGGGGFGAQPVLAAPRHQDE